MKHVSSPAPLSGIWRCASAFLIFPWCLEMMKRPRASSVCTLRSRHCANGLACLFLALQKNLAILELFMPISQTKKWRLSEVQQLSQSAKHSNCQPCWSACPQDPQTSPCSAVPEASTRSSGMCACIMESYFL